MDTDRLANLVRSLSTPPSRRAVNRGLAGLVTGSLFSPLLAPVSMRANGKKGGKKKDKKKKKRNPKDLVPECALGQVPCHDLGCCTFDLCTSCGCCPATQRACCGDATTANRLCYDPAAETCCPTTITGLVGACPKQTFCATGAGGTIPICCPSGAEHCVFGCCPEGLFCCPSLIMCCTDSSCDESKGACFVIAGGDLARMG